MGNMGPRPGLPAGFPMGGGPGGFDIGNGKAAGGRPLDFGIGNGKPFQGGASGFDADSILKKENLTQVFLTHYVPVFKISLD